MGKAWGQRLRFLVTLHPESRAEGEGSWCLDPPFYSAQGPSLCGVEPHLFRGSSLITQAALGLLSHERGCISWVIFDTITWAIKMNHYSVRPHRLWCECHNVSHFRWHHIQDFRIPTLRSNSATNWRTLRTLFALCRFDDNFLEWFTVFQKTVLAFIGLP